MPSPSGRRGGALGAIEHLDLADAMPAALRAALLLPVTSERHQEALPVLDAATLGTLSAAGD